MTIVRDTEMDKIDQNTWEKFFDRGEKNTPNIQGGYTIRIGKWRTASVGHGGFQWMCLKDGAVQPSIFQKRTLQEAIDWMIERQYFEKE